MIRTFENAIFLNLLGAVFTIHMITLSSKKSFLKNSHCHLQKTNLENLSCGTKHPCSIETDMFAQRNKCMMLLRKT